MNKIKSLFVRLAMAPIDLIVGILWYADSYRGFLHWLSINSYEWYWKLDEILGKYGQELIVTKDYNGKDFPCHRVPKHF